MGRGLKIRLACAGALLTTGMAALAVGAQIGVVHLNAGDVKIVFGKGDQGLTMAVAARDCPPHCGFDINWRPMGVTTTTGALTKALTRDLGR